MILDLLERNDEFNSLHSDEAQQSSLQDTNPNTTHLTYPTATDKTRVISVLQWQLPRGVHVQRVWRGEISRVNTIKKEWLGPVGKCWEWCPATGSGDGRVREWRGAQRVRDSGSKKQSRWRVEIRTTVMKEFQIIGPAYPWSLGGSFWIHLISQNSCTWLSERKLKPASPCRGSSSECLSNKQIVI